MKLMQAKGLQVMPKKASITGEKLRIGDGKYRLVAARSSHADTFPGWALPLYVYSSPEH